MDFEADIRMTKDNLELGYKSGDRMRVKFKLADRSSNYYDIIDSLEKSLFSRFGIEMRISEEAGDGGDYILMNINDILQELEAAVEE